MADKKISQLSAASTPLAGTEVLPIVQSSATVKVATNDLTVRNVRANATTGILQVTGPADASTRVMTVPDASFTTARTDAGQTFTGVNTFTSPKVITSLDDTNGNELFKFTATGSAVNELTVANAASGSGPTVSATGSDTNINVNLTPKGALGNVANRGTSLVTLDSTGIYAVASFGKTGIADNTATQICKLTGDTAMFGYVEILYAIEDGGTDVYVGRHSFRMFWEGSALFNSISTENSGVVVPSFTVAGSGNDFIISVTANTIAATYAANFTIRWHSFGVSLNAIAIQEA